MTDEELISYCEAHCQTPRALFSPDQINRMLELAGERCRVESWMSLWDEMADLCRMARKRQAARKQTALILPFPRKEKA